MRILIDAHLSEDKVTGIGRYLNKLIPAILNLDSSNEYFIMYNRDIGSQHPLRRLSGKNMNLIPSSFSGLSIKMHWQLARTIHDYNIDIYHHPHFDLPIKCPVPAVVTVHDLKYLKHPEYFQDLGKLKRLYIYNATKMAMKRSQKIISVSESTKKDIVGMFETNSDKIKTIYHGVEIKHDPKSESKNYLETKGINKPYILFVGERRPHKNLIRLIEAFKELLNQSKLSLQLIIVGKKYKNYNVPENIVRNQSLQDRVLFLENVNDIDLTQLYKRSLLFILPSMYEGFGFPILEAMTLASPVIGSQTSSLPELIGDAGIQINPLDTNEITKSMMELINNESLRKKLVVKGLQQCKKFTWENSARSTIEVYHDIYQQIH